MQSELPVPPSARSDKNARELIRAWAAHNGLHCSVNVGSWGDNERVAWAIVLTDVARHVANALNEEKGWDKALRQFAKYDVYSTMSWILQRLRLPEDS